MISLFVDESHAFDYWSILCVKFLKTGNKDVERQSENCLFSLVVQIGEEKVEEIVLSEECQDLIEYNAQVWDAVDLAKTDAIKASEVDRLNFLRWKAKKRLQTRFFGNSLSEIKKGYESYEKSENC